MLDSITSYAAQAQHAHGPDINAHSTFCSYGSIGRCCTSNSSASCCWGTSSACDQVICMHTTFR